MDLVRDFELKQIEGINRPILKAGDIVRIGTKVVEGDKSRVQSFEGTILGVRGSGPSTSFTVRRETGKFAVERVFPLYSPLITNIEIVKRQKVRRAKLFYLRQEGRRRVKEDGLAMQRHVKEESDKKRLAAEAIKRADEAAAEEEKKAKKAEEKTSEEPTETK
ncbi:MAG: 50S ribosomal protein L19 [Candidatus Andersenbacteria bacterium RIFCSPHIGHO2_02_FULL_45_11]|uniref:50S ribosomal protein L19 n=1 Tax=Candidatus Andersenbacteria bacterium RIFCSPHIGHO2_12_FULL_45_11 TaxID=1797281 RepID=A0A1G1X676_9BACT|nr:MAG: 50S ribosomal protein L19 [Candidatus Andersenbacteria bacterium RIFCSPHIGHO2_01_FULL_46_36]OGY33621.1 MAG: 50S ribosomal protein L19 [Candidatus Andersenbacteria bacterium RIFCSPHIGHO2_02_FULL_45_11]OGY35291.1 MAG: 50S ribosomal protein L19 [Candidatus Andersenbacteria bacterium RIFCSPHIGHO2_12_FULL_45_11]